MRTGGRRRALAGVVAVAVALALAACGSGGIEDEFEESGEAGFGVAQLQSADQVEGVREPIRGTVSVASNGCLRLLIDDGSSPWIVWPPDSELADNGGVIADGSRYYDGDVLVGAGVLVDLADLPDGDNPDSYFSAFGGYCGADETGVVVFDAVAHAEA